MVFYEILPSIRRTGGYIPVTDTMSDQEILARAFLVAKKTIEMQKEKIAKHKAKIEQMQPKLEFADSV